VGRRPWPFPIRKAGRDLASALRLRATSCDGLLDEAGGGLNHEGEIEVLKGQLKG